MRLAYQWLRYSKTLKVALRLMNSYRSFPVLVDKTWKLSLNTRFRASKPSVLPHNGEAAI